MASEKTHAEARFKNESMSSGTDSDSPEVLYEKYSQHLEEKMTVKGLVHTELGVCKKQFDHTK
ncbi:hypothetical protein GW7_17315 [Heterocephalus glaber]|uniref:Uncharacterized protein n=1 Tax=Heterocephalus glaber TaxID=10181 RepID=G5BPN5_HETGA|nr:hypothetical protein GW7_17315 [Heterocephalus glaber]